MIVRNQSDGTVVMITQNDHAKLAGLFAAHWGNDSFARPQPYASIVRAAQYHDGGWLRYETNPYIDPATGKSPSYQQVPNDTPQLAAYQWAIDMLTEVDSYTGLMVSRHRTGLWQQRYSAIRQPSPGGPRKLSPEIQAFITRNEARQDAIAAGLDREEVAVNYNLLQVWDLMSLYICSNEQHQECTIEPVPTAYANGGGPGGVAMRLVPTSPSRIAIKPFPFDQAPLEAAVVYRQLPQTALRDEDTFRAAYFGARPQVASFTFVAA
jgi:Protein of unknown function (DUF3891)